jgi:(Z)-2-((N-methylformamido)methylene)-5-hydroxybutyrolactone dehydrogenase
MQKYQMHIGGQWLDAADGEVFESSNPYTGKPWALIPRGRAADAERAVEAAHDAFSSGPWPRLTASARGHLLRRLGDLVAENAERLARIEVTDNGKLISEMLGQLRYVPQWYYYFGGLADKLEGAVIPIDKPDTFNFTRHEPLGVCVAITPWNSPLLLATWKLAPGLAAGNTFVLKPSEFTSASALEFVKLVEQAGFPPGVVNVVTGFGPEVGEPLVVHPKVAKIAFTGSEAGGQRLYEAAARGLKRVTLELGGKSPNIVFDDASLDDAVEGVISGIFAATGQTCIAGSRLLVQQSIHNEFLDRLVAFAKAARMGDPQDAETQVGPVTTPPQYKKILDYIEVAKGEGAACVLGGGPADRPEAGEGWFVEPTGCASRRRRCSARCWRPFPSGTRTRRSRSRTTFPTGWRRASGHRASVARSRCPSASRRERCGSTPIGPSATCRRSAATSDRGSVARTAWTRSANTCRPRASGSAARPKCLIPSSCVDRTGMAVAGSAAARPDSSLGGTASSGW